MTTRTLFFLFFTAGLTSSFLPKHTCFATSIVSSVPLGYIPVCARSSSQRGDFIDSSPHFIPACAAALEKIDARAGVFVCLGIHDYWVGAHSVAEASEKGYEFCEMRCGMGVF